MTFVLIRNGGRHFPPGSYLPITRLLLDNGLTSRALRTGTLYHEKSSPQLMASSWVPHVYSATASFQFPTIMFSCSHLSQTIHILCPGSRRTRTSFLRLRCRSAETIVLICRTAITFPHSAQRIGYRSSLTLSPPPTALSASRQVRIPPGQSRTSRMVLRIRP